MEPVSGLYSTTFLDPTTHVRLDVTRRRAYYVYPDSELEFESHLQWTAWETHVRRGDLQLMCDPDLAVDEGL